MSAHGEIVGAVRRLAAAHPHLRDALTFVMERVNTIEHERLELLEQASSGFPVGDPDDGAEQVALHVSGRTLRETLREMAQLQGLSPGGVSTLHLPAGEHGPLLVGHEPSDVAWAPYLLAGRTLRVVGPTAASISGSPALSVHRGAGECAGMTLEVWRVLVQGPVHAVGHKNATVRLLRGAAVRATPAVPAQGVPL